MVKRVLDKDRYIFLEKPAMEVYNKVENGIRAQQIEEYINELKTYDLSLKKLSTTQFDKKERSQILNLALILVSEDKLLEKLDTQKRIPVKSLSRIAEVPIFELEKWNDLILAYSILFRSEKYRLIKRYLQYDVREKEDSFPIDSGLHSGLALKKDGRHAYIITSQGQFMKVRDDGNSLGDVTTGKASRKRLNLLKPMIAVLIISLILGLVYQSMASQIERTIILRGSGEVKMDFNPMGNLVTISGNNATGRELIAKAEFDALDIDTVLAEIIEQAYISETIKERSEIIILVSGEFLPEDFFKSGKTHDRILSYQLKTKINNNGSFLYLE